jgi:hypothetical protein
MAPRATEDPMPSLPSWPVIVAALGWGAFIAWSLYRLGSRRAQMGTTTYNYGVKRFGIALWLVSVALEVVVVSQTGPKHYLVLLHALTVAFVTLPVCLWVGYVWGQAMHELLPHRRRKRPTPP